MNAHVLPRHLRLASEALRGRGIGGLITQTAGCNLALTATAGLGGILIARTVGPSVRGEYAAVPSWFGLLSTVGYAGQTAAVCFYVAHDPRRARGYVATARAIMLTTGGAAVLTGVLLAPVLAHGNEALADAYRLTFGGLVFAFTAAAYMFSLPACSIRRWNQVRLSQPVCGLAGIVLLWQLRLLNLGTAVDVLLASLAVQLGFAYYWCRRFEMAPGCAQVKYATPLLKYGLSRLLAVAPAALNGYLDQLVLSQVAPSAELGNYAIAVSLTLLPVPLVAAIGYVAFPRLAAQRTLAARDRRLTRLAMLVSAGLATAVLLLIAASAEWLIPLVFGTEYLQAVPLVWILTPGGVFLACGQVASDLLSGLGRPGLVGTAQGLAAVFTVVMLLVLLPSMGVTAAALASTVAYAVALAVMLWCLWHLTPGETAQLSMRMGRHRRRWRRSGGQPC